VLDFSDNAFRAQLIDPGSYDGRLVDIRQVGHGPAFLALSWELDVPGRDHATIEEMTYVEVEPGAGDPAQAALGRALLKAIFQAHGIEPTFDSYDAVIGAIIGRRMRVILLHTCKAGLPLAKIAALLPPATEDH
jgi:hypothetical protein